MTRKKRDDRTPRTPEAPDGRETPFESQASASEPAKKPAPAEKPVAQKPEKNGAAAGGPIAATPATPATQDAESAAAEAPTQHADEPVAATPETQHAEPEETAADSQPQSVPARPSEAAPRRAGISGAGAFMLGLLAALLVLGLAAAGLWASRDQVAALLIPADDRIGAVEGRAVETGQRIDELAGRVDGVERALATLRDDIARLPQQGGQGGGEPAAPAIDPARLDQLAQRLQGVEAAQGSRVDPAQVAAIEQNVQSLGQELAALKDALTGVSKSAADAATVLRLTDRIEAAETAVREAESRVNTAQNLLLAVGQLREAVNRGESFDSELRAVGAIADGDAQVGTSLQGLAPYAAKGVPTRMVLADRFDELAGRVVRADFGPDEDGWWRQTVQRLTSVVTVRRTEGDVAGDSVAAMVARAEAALDKGNLAGAVQELQALQGPSAQTAAPWLQDAQARLSAEKALSDLTAHVVAQTKAGG